MELLGYKRHDGTVGIRNHLLVVPTVVCANHVAIKISNQLRKSVVIPHQHGCGQLGVDLEQTFRTLAGYGKNPNVAAVLVVGLGCEAVCPHNLCKEIAKTNKLVEVVIIQEEGGTLRAIEKGVKIGKEMAIAVSRVGRELCDISELVVGLECGGSDTTSGLAANPAVGAASDKLVKEGATVILSETTELIGAEHLLAKRAPNKEAKRIFEIVNRMEKRAMEMGIDMRGANPSPGNIKGGITTIEEKSLGAIHKAGHTPISGVLEYGEKPSSKGLYIMDTPGHDVESITGMVAGGAQIVIFTTGVGTPVGAPIVPVAKVTGNPRTYDSIKDNIDIDVSAIIEGKESIELAGDRLFKYVLEVIRGRKTKSEVLGHWEFAINRIGPTL